MPFDTRLRVNYHHREIKVDKKIIITCLVRKTGKFYSHACYYQRTVWFFISSYYQAVYQITIAWIYRFAQDWGEVPGHRPDDYGYGYYTRVADFDGDGTPV